jgi:hypothetical protein
MASGRHVEPTMFSGLLSARISGQRLAMTADDLTPLITAQRHRHKLEKPDEASPNSTTAC